MRKSILNTRKKFQPKFQNILREKCTKLTQEPKNRTAWYWEWWFTGKERILIEMKNPMGFEDTVHDSGVLLAVEHKSVFRTTGSNLRQHRGESLLERTKPWTLLHYKIVQYQGSCSNPNILTGKFIFLFCYNLRVKILQMIKLAVKIGHLNLKASQNHIKVRLWMVEISTRLQCV